MYYFGFSVNVFCWPLDYSNKLRLTVGYHRREYCVGVMYLLLKDAPHSGISLVLFESSSLSVILTSPFVERIVFGDSEYEI